MLIKNLINEEIDKKKNHFIKEMKIYHSFNRKNGFNLNNYDFERGIFGLGDDTYDWARKQYGVNHDYANPFRPNEFGDTTVEIEIRDNVKIYTIEHQLDALINEFPNSKIAKKIIDSFNRGDFGWNRFEWHRLDKMIGKFLRKKGYQLIHYTADEMYGDTWAIIDKNIIKSIKYG